MRERVIIMQFTSKGIGWLIVGGIICATAIGTDSFASAVGMLMFGLVFVAVYFIKQLCDPKGLGWFIFGGILLAFCIDTMLGVTGGLLRDSILDREDLSDVLIALIMALGCMFAFYRKNKGAVDDLAADMGMDMPAGHEPDIVVESEVTAEEGNASEVEFEISTSEDREGKE